MFYDFSVNNGSIILWKGILFTKTSRIYNSLCYNCEYHKHPAEALQFWEPAKLSISSLNIIDPPYAVKTRIELDAGRSRGNFNKLSSTTENKASTKK